MKRRDWILASASSAGAVSLMLLAVRIGKLQPALMASQIRNAASASLAALVVLTAVHIFLSNEKWRMVDAVLRIPGDAVPSRGTSFGITAVGVALGQILPIQVGVIAGRTIGTRFFGRAFSRGTLGSMFEQGFDVLVMTLLAVGSCVTLVFHGGRATWLLASGVILAMALLATGPVFAFARRVGTSASTARLLGRTLSESMKKLCQAGLLDPGLARKLTALSIARFIIQTLMAADVCAAVDIHIPIWHLAASIPLVILACVVVLTPGGIGVGELSYAGVLHLFGTPINVAIQWAVTARILISASCFTTAAVVGCAAVAELRWKRKRSSLKTADLACSQ